jgi:hypothetical protein
MFRIKEHPSSGSTFKYFIILFVSTYYILCISWIIKCLIIIDARLKHEDCNQIYERQLPSLVCVCVCVVLYYSVSVEFYLMTCF